jgi:hypothetical protein
MKILFGFLKLELEAGKIFMQKTPIIFLHEDNSESYKIFNPNAWSEKSKLVISSCAAQYGILTHITSQLPHVLQNNDDICKVRFQELLRQWEIAPWDLNIGIYFIENPQFHLFAQSYLLTIKTFLDVLVQLCATEGIVSNQVNGFHKKSGDPGRRLLNSLQKNPISEKCEVAQKIFELIEENKTEWIDNVIKARDELTHPQKGMPQIMSTLEIKIIRNTPELAEIYPPSIDGVNFDNYAQNTLVQLKEFSQRFLSLLKPDMS